MLVVVSSLTVLGTPVIDELLGPMLFRLVDQDALSELDHYLPALYFGLNATGDAVATHF
jgi:hypothetical protein